MYVFRMTKLNMYAFLWEADLFHCKIMINENPFPNFLADLKQEWKKAF